MDRDTEWSTVVSVREDFDVDFMNVGAELDGRFVSGPVRYTKHVLF
jgi:hypothetical protein